MTFWNYFLNIGALTMRELVNLFPFFLLFFSCSILPLHVSLWRLNWIDRSSFLCFLFLFYSLSFFIFFSRLKWVEKSMNSTTTFSSSKSTLDDTQQRTVMNSKKPITRVKVMLKKELYSIPERFIYRCCSLWSNLLSSRIRKFLRIERRVDCLWECLNS